MIDNTIEDFYKCLEGSNLGDITEYDGEAVEKILETMKQMRAFTNDKKDWDKRIRAVQDLLIKIKQDKELRNR